MTAAEVLSAQTKYYTVEDIEGTDRMLVGQDDILPAMITFAKLHVKAALEVASKKVSLERYYPSKGGGPSTDEEDYEASYTNPYVGDDDSSIKVNEESILNAYPETEIK